MYFDERENHLDYLNQNNEVNSYENNYSLNQNKKFDNDIKFDINNININNIRKETSNDLYSLTEGLNKGNSFVKEYVPYKNYIYKVIVRGERDELLLKIQELTFRLVDLNLFLDVNPNDEKIYMEFKETAENLKKYKEMYEKNYGPLSVCETSFYNSYKWLKNPWPWMNEGGNN